MKHGPPHRISRHPPASAGLTADPIPQEAPRGSRGKTSKTTASSVRRPRAGNPPPPFVLRTGFPLENEERVWLQSRTLWSRGAWIENETSRSSSCSAPDVELSIRSSERVSGLQPPNWTNGSPGPRRPSLLTRRPLVSGFDLPATRCAFHRRNLVPKFISFITPGRVVVF